MARNGQTIEYMFLKWDTRAPRKEKQVLNVPETVVPSPVVKAR